MRGARILIVEDEPITAFSEEVMLKEAGYQVVGIVDTGEDAIKFANDENPDLILMDITLMGEMDGIQAAGAIKELHNIPVIFVTAHKEEKIFERAKKIAPFAYITKPISQESLKYSIEIALYKNQMDTRLRKSEEQYRTLVETTPHGIQEIDTSGNILFCNNALCRMLGYSAAEMKGMNVADLLPEEGRERVMADIAKFTKEQPNPFPCFNKNVTKDGRIIDLEVNWGCKRNKRGDVVGFISIITNITEHKRVKTELEASDRDRRTALEALDHIPIGIVIVREDGRIRFANDTAKEIAKGGGLNLDNDRLSTSRQEETGHLLSYIKKAIRSALEGVIIPGEALIIERPDEKPPLQVVISTLWGNHQRLGMGHLDEPHGILFITDPERPQESPAELLQRLFGLTRAEARLTERLVNGDSVKEAAAELSITEGTARSTLSIIFNKTGTSRQPELVKAVMSSPAWIGLQEQRERFLG